MADIRDYLTVIDPERLQPAPGPGGLMGLLNRPGVRQGMLATGLALLQQKDQRGSLGGALGHALPQGVQAYQQGQQEAGLAQAMAGLPPNMQAVLNALPTAQRAMALMQMQQPPEVPQGADRFINAGDGQLYDTVNSVWVEAPGGKEPSTDDIQEYEFATQNGFQGSLLDFLTAQRSAGAPRTDINLPGGGDAAITSTLASGFERARGAQRSIARVERAMQIAETPEFESVTGRFNTFKEQLAAIGKESGLSDGQALALADEYQALVGELAVAELSRFGAGSGLSDRDLAEAKGLVGANRSMDARALRAILQIVKRSQEEIIADHREATERARRMPQFREVVDFYTLDEDDTLDARYGIVR